MYRAHVGTERDDTPLLAVPLMGETHMSAKTWNVQNTFLSCVNIAFLCVWVAIFLRVAI